MREIGKVRVLSVHDAATALAADEEPDDILPDGFQDMGERSIADEGRWTYREAAALLGAFQVAALPAGRDEAGDKELAALIAMDCERVSTSAGARWRLLPEVRAVTLNRMRDPSRMLKALRHATRDPLDIAGAMAEAYLRGAAPPLSRQSIDQLHGTLQFAEWLLAAPLAAAGLADRGIVVPALDDVHSRIEPAALFQPLRALAGEHFTGREDELRRMTDYVEVLPPEALTFRYLADSVSRGVRKVFRLGDRPPLVIHGLGGVGKSTLIARFVLDHAGTVEHRHLPFAYLSFDRADLDPEQPVTLLAAATHQLGVLYPQVADRARRLEAALHATQQAHSAQSEEDNPTARGLARIARGIDEESLISRFARLVADVAHGHGGDPLPLLLVLDTMEQAQRRGDVAITRLWGFLDELQGVLPRLRVVFAGRAPLPLRPVRELHLKEFDDDVALAFLRDHLGRGAQRDARFLRSVVKRVGGSPLTLKLAAELIQREGKRGLSGIDTRRQILFRLTQEEIQGVLYRRILDHLDDPDLRRIASPGLTVRRVTPDVIRQVLAVPCGLGFVSEERAYELFRLLAAEASLVEPVPGQDAVVHRADVRRAMLPLLCEDVPEQANEIHRRAKDYYEAGTGIEAKTEELYHRLALGQRTSTLDRHWSTEATGLLEGAMAELPASSQVYLADRLGLTADKELLVQADEEAWARQAVRLARSLLGEGRPAEALAELRRRGRTERPEIARMEIEALAAMGDTGQAMLRVGRALELSVQAGRPATFVATAVLGARIAEDTGKFKDAEVWLAQAREATDATGKAVERITVSVAQLRLHRRAGTSHSPEASRLREEVIGMSVALSDGESSRNPGLMREIAAEVGDSMRSFVSRAVRLTGVDVAGSAGGVLVDQLSTADVEDFAAVVHVPEGQPLQWLGEHTSVEQGAHVSTYLESEPEPEHSDSWAGALVEAFRHDVDAPAWEP